MSFNFAQRVGYFPLNVEEDTNVIERDYLLGGKGTETSSSSIIIDDPLPKAYNLTISWFANWSVLVLGIGLVLVCALEGQDSRNADENCPLLAVGIGIGAVVILNAFIGLVGLWSRKSELGFFTIKFNIYVSLFLMLISILFAIAVLIHWDIYGQPAHPLLFPIETVGVRHRYLIWGTALAIALASVIQIYGILGLAHSLPWLKDESIFSTTLYMSCILISLAGIGMTSTGIAVWWSGEMKQISNPMWMIGSLATGVALFVVGLIGLTTVRKKEHIDNFLIWLPVVSACVILFSIGNAATAEPNNVNERRTLVLLSALIGIWGQIHTVVAIVAASNWRHNLKVNSLKNDSS